MVDPHTAAAGTGTLMTVVVFLGSQLSPSIMIRRAVKKEFKAAALLEQNGSNIDSDGWAVLTELDEAVQDRKLSPDDTTWGKILKHPFKLLLRAHQYHDATAAYLYQTRSISAQAMLNAARSAACQNAARISAASGGVGVTAPREAADTRRYVEQDSAADVNLSYASYDSVLEVDDPYVTHFNNITIIAGTKVRITLHFGVGDIPAILNPCTQLPGVPAWYSGPLVLSGFAKLFPSSLDSDRYHSPDVVIGRRMYDLEFHGMRWSVPPNHRVSVSKVEDDGASIASLEAAYGGNRSTMMMLDDEIDLLTPYYRPIAPR